jgi:uncharacterized protein (TIGR02246 family)
MSRTNSSLALIGVATLTLAAGGCAKQGAGSSDPAAVQKAIKADEVKWNQEFKARDQEALLNHYAEDAFFVGTGVPGANGATEIRKVYAGGLADHYFSVSFASDKIDSSGDLAYARGHFTESFQDPKSHQIVTDKGSYLTIYKKQSDGSWKAVEDFAASDPATRTEKSAVVKPPKMISSGF